MRGVVAAAEGIGVAAGTAVTAVFVGFVLVRMGPVPAFAIATLPLVAVAVVYLLTSGQLLLFGAVVAMPMSALPIFVGPILGPLYAADVVVGLALGAVILARFVLPGQLPAVPRTPVLGLPLAVFGVVVVAATLRGHEAYGASLFGQPLRLALYSAIVGAFIGVSVPRMYAFLQALFYGVAVYAVMLSFYVLAGGGVIAEQAILSTGGTRILPIGLSLYCAGSLFFAMLSLRFGFGSWWLHIAMGAIALYGVVLGFGRAVYLAVAVVGLLLLVTSPRLRRSIYGAVPIVLPFLVLAATGIALAAPQLVEATSGRLFSSPESDANVRWRVEANSSVLEHVREQPIVGVGFGRPAEFFLELPHPATGLPVVHRIDIGQDPHNGYMLFLAGGGVLLLAAFLFVIVTFARDVVRRYRANADPQARLVVLWASALLFTYLVNAASTTTFSVPGGILMVWALLVLPAIVRPGGSGEIEITPHAETRHAAKDRAARPLVGAP